MYRKGNLFPIEYDAYLSKKDPEFSIDTQNFRIILQCHPYMLYLIQAATFTHIFFFYFTTWDVGS